jgi:thioredoxin-like negative regulator of GroEL
MFIRALSIFIAVTIFTAVAFPAPTGTIDEYRNAVEMHEKTRAPLLVFVGAGWCGPCQEMKTNVIPHVDMKDVIYCYFDYDSDPALAQQITKSRSIPGITVYHYLEDGTSAAKRLHGLQSARTIEELIRGVILQPVH